MPEELRISGLWPESIRKSRQEPLEVRAPIVELDPFPFPWWGEGEYELDPEKYPGYYGVEYGGERQLSDEDLNEIRIEYPQLVSIGTHGPNIVADDQILALADEFERASNDGRLGRPWRLGLAARLLRRFAGRVAQVKIPGL